MTDALVEAATKVVSVARDAGIPLRLLGGLAVRVQAPGWPGRPSSTHVDIDFVTTTAGRKRAGELLAGMGFVPDKHHNALFGRRQMYFFDPDRAWGVDVIVDRLAMCHVVDLRDRLELDPVTIPLADLLLSKLQIVKLNAKDALDVLALLASHPIGPTDDSISLPRILDHTSRDWGWWRTVSANLDWIHTFALEKSKSGPLWTAGYDPIDQSSTLSRDIDAAKKSIAWAVRSKIGDRLPWYDEPEEVGHEV